MSKYPSPLTRTVSSETEERQRALARIRPWIDRASRFSGWVFPEIHVRDLEPGPQWDFIEVVRSRGVGCKAALDLGTGGGELLASIRPDLPDKVTATEEWAVNAPIASKRLAPLGVPVVRAKSVRLPFRSGSFDFVMNRHEEFDPGEIDRVLMPGGSFITQQVGQHDRLELRPFFSRMTDFGDLRSEYVAAFQRLGFRVESAEHDHHVAYASLGEFAFMLAVAPWDIPEFDAERDLDALLAFESEHGTEEGVVVTECRFLLVAHEKASP